MVDLIAVTSHDTRRSLGLAEPKSRSTAIIPTHVAGHYAAVGTGDTAWRLEQYTSHEVCRDRWKRMQTSAMRGAFSDIPYTAMPCHHNVVMAGRGARVRTGANGSDHWNYRAYALCFPLGGYDRVDPEDPRIINMLRAWWTMIDVLSKDAGRSLTPTLHRTIRRTSCPGNIGTYLLDRRYAKLDSTLPPPPPPPQEDDMVSLRRGDDNFAVGKFKAALNRRYDTKLDGTAFDADMARSVERYQRDAGILGVRGVVPGVLDSLTQGLLLEYVVDAADPKPGSRGVTEARVREIIASVAPSLTPDQVIQIVADALRESQE